MSANQDQTPEADPTTESDSAGSATQPNEARAAGELAAQQDAALDDGSQESLLRMLGWRPGDPLPDDLVTDEGAPSGTSAFDGSHDDPADDDPYDLDGADLPGAVSDVGLLPDAEPEPVVPINWNTLDAERAEQEWWQLDAFVYWLRDDFGLTPQELPPLWHRHTELVWELSALRTAWLAAHAPDAHPGSPLMWLRDLTDSRRRLRDWVQRCGTTLTEDRPTRRTTWPGEQSPKSPAPVAVTDRAADFAVFVTDDIARRRRIETEAQTEIEQARAHRIQRLREAWRLPTPGADNPAQGGPGQSGDGHEPGTEEGTS